MPAATPIVVHLHDSSAWVVFAAAFGGALVGGLATALGSLAIARRALTRDARIRLYDEVIPRLEERSSSYTPGWDSVAERERFRRVAKIAGRRDHRHALRVGQLMDEHHGVWQGELDALKAAGSIDPGGPTAMPVTTAHRLLIEDRLAEFQHWLGERIR